MLKLAFSNNSKPPSTVRNKYKMKTGLGKSLHKRWSMKIKNILTVLILTLILTSCTSTAALPTETAIPKITIAPREDNFSLVFQYFTCASIPLNVLDTESGTIVHTPLGDTKSITFSYRLTEIELEAIYQKSMAIGFFDYPTVFVIPDDQVLGELFPSSRYEISMTNGEMTNSVTWDDGMVSNPDYEKATSLRELITLIEQIIQSYLETQELPEPKVGCA